MGMVNFALRGRVSENSVVHHGIIPTCTRVLLALISNQGAGNIEKALVIIYGQWKAMTAVFGIHTMLQAHQRKPHLRRGNLLCSRVLT